MLTIRPEQIETLSDASREEFLGRMDAHIREHFAPVVGLLTMEQLREIIERNWKRAEEYGLISELGVCSYLNVVFTLGEGFEKQPTHAWASPLLNDSGIEEVAKLERLDVRVQAALKKNKVEEDS